MRRTGSSSAFLCALGAALIGSGASAQEPEPISLDHFQGWEEWPLHEPGDLPTPGDKLATQRTFFRFTTPDGRVMRMALDVLQAYLHGEPAIWVQHTSSGTPGDTAGTSVIDALLVDRETFRIAYRIQATPGDRSWAGPYDLVQHHPDRVVRISVADDGTVEREVLDEPTNAFDFATMPYLFPFIGLEEGLRFRLVNVGRRGDPEPRQVAIRVMGRTTIDDARGRPHEVWELQLLSHTGRTLVQIYVAEEPPWFYGWRYRVPEDGRTLTRLDYLDHVVFEGEAAGG